MYVKAYKILIQKEQINILALSVYNIHTNKLIIQKKKRTCILIDLQSRRKKDRKYTKCKELKVDIILYFKNLF